MPPARRSPADRKPKTGKDEVSFTHDGRTYVLPAPSEALLQIPGRALRDALMASDGTGELKLMFMCLEAVGAAPGTVDALYEKPIPEMMGIASKWFQSADLSGATLPQS